MSVQFSQFTSGNEMMVTDVAVGLRTSGGVTSNYQFNFPGTGIKDSTGAYLVKWLPSGGTNVNYVQFTNSASAVAPQVASAGNDSNISLNLSGKGTGYVYCSQTNAFGLPNGTTAQRPTGFASAFRYNSTTDLPEYYSVNSVTWNSLAPFSGTFTQGSVIFAGALNLLSQDNAQFYWDDTNHRLGVGTAAPSVDLHIKKGSNATTNNITCENTDGASASSNAAIEVKTATSGGNPYYIAIAGTQNWAWGVDAADSNKWKLSANAAIATSPIMTITTAGVLSLSTPLPVTSGGTALSSTTINQILYSSAANTIAGLASTNRAALSTNSTGVPTWLALTDGQLVVGSTAGSPAAATLTAGTGVTITNASNSISIASNGAGIWNDVTGTSATMAVNNGYIADNVALVTLTVPATAALGDTFRIVGKGAGGWKIQMNTGQVANLGNLPTSATGSLASTNQWDCITLTCVIANTTFACYGVQGNITVA